jgi:uncharacterized protein (DUF342 family)
MQPKFDLQYLDGHACLIVPHSSVGTVYPEEVLARMRLLGMPRVREKVIEEAIELSSGEPIPLVAWPDGARLQGRVEIEVADDAMSASAVFVPPKRGGSMVDEAGVVASLEEAGVISGIDLDAIRHALQHEAFNTQITVARGTHPIDGVAGEYEILFNLDRGRPYRMLTQSRIDLKELNFVEMVEVGAVLAQLKDPIEPQNGVDVRGAVLPARAAQPPQLTKAGTGCTAEGDQILATVRGNARLKGDTILVDEIVEVQTVDYGTGNIDFEGTVLVDETIADGFRVKARGDVIVGQTVGRVSIEAGGDIILKGGMNGAGEGELKAGGNLVAHYLESLHARAGGNVVVEEAIRNSSVETEGHVGFTRGRAEVMGGAVLAGGSVWCNRFGSSGEVASRVSIGVSPVLFRTLGDAFAAQKDRQNKLDGLDKKISQLQQHQPRDQEESRRVLDAIRKLEAAIAATAREMDDESKRILELRRRLVPAPGALFVAEDVMHFGTRVTFGRDEFVTPERGARKTILRFKSGEIVEEGFNPRERPTHPMDGT